MEQDLNTETNSRQKEFYNNKKKNFATRIWSYFRNGILNKTRKSIGVEHQIHQLHLEWLGDLSGKKVLDLGCYEGNSLSIYLAKNAKEYIAIDLSENGIQKLSKRLNGVPNAKAMTIDFLSPDFVEKDFDIIYAYGVLHHFKDLGSLIYNLKKKLKEEGFIISYDPLKTSFPIKLLRMMYRPFQTDKDWEWPFSKENFHLFNEAFNIRDRRAVLGKAKWFFVINFLPLSSQRKFEIVKKWHQEDWKNSQVSDSYMFSCMHLTMLMQKPN